MRRDLPTPLDVRRLLIGAGALLALILASAAGVPSSLADALEQAPQAVNPHPYELRLPPSRPLSAMAQLGERLFHDPRLSGSGRMSCASCHDPAHAYGPPGSESVVLGGPDMRTPGFRAVPSLGYLYRQPPFTIGPDTENGTAPVASLQRQSRQAASRELAVKTALTPRAAAVNLVPQGGLFWDGRADTLQQQANGPLFNPAEMDAGTAAVVLSKLQAYYGDDFKALFGPYLFHNPRLALDEAMFAIGRYQSESGDFHPFSSKYDAWLAGRARLAPPELRGLQAFDDPDKGNCAACHLDKPTPDGLPPLFTDYQFEALGVPRNAAIAANNDPSYHDLGICGPFRSDMRTETRYCGMFITPTLRNIATRKVFFHNGVFHSLQQVLEWYVYRDLEPARYYSRDARGHVIKYDDLPASYRGNIDVVDPPFTHHPGDPPALSAAEIQDVIAFLNTLTDGYTPSDRKRGR